METKNMIYLVSEYASQGEIFGKWISWNFLRMPDLDVYTLTLFSTPPSSTRIICELSAAVPEVFGAI